MILSYCGVFAWLCLENFAELKKQRISEIKAGLDDADALVKCFVDLIWVCLLINIVMFVRFDLSFFGYCMYVKLGPKLQCG